MGGGFEKHAPLARVIRVCQECGRKWLLQDPEVVEKLRGVFDGDH